MSQNKMLAHEDEPTKKRDDIKISARFCTIF
jgi:hypothetical protein